MVLCTGAKASDYATSLEIGALAPAVPRLSDRAMAQPSLSARGARVSTASRVAPCSTVVRVLALSLRSDSGPLAASGPKVQARNPDGRHQRPSSRRNMTFGACGRRGHDPMPPAPHIQIESQDEDAEAAADAHAADSEAAEPVDAKDKKRSRASTSTSSSTSSGTHTSTSLSSHSSTHIEDDGEMRLSFSGDGITIKAEATGEVKFNEDETDSESISRGGSFKIDERSRGERHRLEIISEDSGLERTYWVNGDRHEFDADGRRWLAGSLERLFLGTGYGAERRAQRVFEREGAEGVMRQVHASVPTTRNALPDGCDRDRQARRADGSAPPAPSRPGNRIGLRSVAGHVAVTRTTARHGTVDAYLEAAGKIDSITRAGRRSQPSSRWTARSIALRPKRSSAWRRVSIRLRAGRAPPAVLEDQAVETELTPAFLQAVGD